MILLCHKYGLGFSVSCQQFSYLYSIQFSYLYSIQFTSIKYIKNHYFGEIWPYWKMDTGKHNFHEILLLF